jgi:hypothetical protein
MVSLVRPGGWVASFESDLLSHICDPPLPEWTRLVDAYTAYSAAQGIDLFVARRTHRLFRAAGVVDIDVDAVVRVYPAGDHRRLILRDFINNVREKLIDGGFIGRSDLDRDVTALERHVSNPEVLGSRLIKSTIREQQRGKQRPDSCAPICRNALRCA